MEIIFNEIKKIFNFKMCVGLLIGTYLIYNLFISFEIKYFPNGRPTLDYYNITAKMIEDYGQEMDEEEFIDFQGLYDEKILEADKFLSNNKDFNKYGIYSYEDYIQVKNDKFGDMDKEFNEMYWENLNSEDGNRFWELQTMPAIISRYKGTDDYSQWAKDKKYEERIRNIIKGEENKSILGSVVFDNYNNLIKMFSVAIIIGIGFMLTPIFLKDKRDKLEDLQYTSKKGRLLFKNKLIAGLISAMIITTVELIICMRLYSGSNTSMFFKSNINSIFNMEFWVSMTFIQYIILTVVCVYILSIITAFISMFVSSKVNTYVAAIGVQVPTIFILGGLTSKLLMNNLTIMYKSKYLSWVVYLILIVITIAITVYSIRKENNKDVII